MRRGITIRFPDGETIDGANAVEALRAWREEQWNATDELGFREELAKRAYVWNSVIINIKGSALSLLLELQRAGLIKVEAQ